jgi:tricorn protease
MWFQGKIYFLSDRDGTVTLHSYDPRSKQVIREIDNQGFDLKYASAGADVIVYEQFGSLHLFDPKTKSSTKVNIQVSGDFPALRPRYEKVAENIRAADISPTGARAVFEARGEIVTVPAEKGDIRNLTQTPGVCERDPAWSPDGKWIAYFSDASGEYDLHLSPASLKGEVRKIKLGDAPSFYYSPVWSPDSKKIAYSDKRLNLWVLDVASGKSAKVDTNTYENPFRSFDPKWSPDSQWLTYTKQGKNHLHAVHLYSAKTGLSHRLTDGMSDARYPVFDKGGKYLFFTASTDVGPSTGWLDMSSFNRVVTRSVYLVVLDRSLPSPLAPESDDEKAEEEKVADAKKPAEAKAAETAKAKEPKAIKVDLEGIDQRILALPVPPDNYIGLIAGKANTLFIAEGPSVAARGPAAMGITLHKFDLTTRKTDKVMEGVTSFTVAANGEKVLYRQGQGPAQRWVIAAVASLGAARAPGTGGGAAGGGALRTDAIEVQIDPRAEWKQMYREVWRIQRDFCYDPGYHGLDLQAAIKKYEPFVAGLTHRADLNYLFDEMVGELTLGHTYVAGGDTPRTTTVPGGLLGADYRIENGRYRFAKVYNGENWNPQLRAPLTQPGVNVKEGEYLLAVDGKELTASDSVYRFFENKAGKAVVIKVGPNANGQGAREVTVVPVASEVPLRNFHWIESNRRKVYQMSGGKLAYVYLPDTAGGGYTNFNRYYFAQVDKDGAIIDERFNGGGTAADYIVDYMRRPLMNYWTTREGQDFRTPVGSIFGPKVMVINEFAGSGGDALPWYFRTAGVGPLVGKRTWGGLVGIYDYPPLMDGGFVTAPRVAFWNPNGTWEVENHGVAPDKGLEVDLDPYLCRQGRDPQLEKAVEVALAELQKNPAPKHTKPPYPNYHKKDDKKVTETPTKTSPSR